MSHAQRRKQPDQPQTVAANLACLPARPKKWQDFIAPIGPDQVEIWETNSTIRVLEFASVNGRWRCLWKTGDIEEHPYLDGDHRVIFMPDEQIQSLRKKQPLIDISKDTKRRRFRFARPGEKSND